MLARSALAVVALSACSEPEGPHGFTLELDPRFLDGQDPLEDAPDVELLVQRPESEPELVHLGEAADGAALTLPDVEPFEPDTTLGLLLADGEGGWVAYGQAVLEDPAAGTLGVLVPKIGEVGPLGALTGNQRRFMAAAAVVPGGDAYLFGGHALDDVDDSDGSDRIFVLHGADGGETDLVAIDTRLPAVDDMTGLETSARCAATATPVEVDGRAQVLLVGGRADADPNRHVAQWMLFDPDDEEIARKGKLELPHSGHLAVPFRNGKVLIYGGYTVDPFAAFQTLTYEIWSPSGSERGSQTPALATGWLHAMGAPLGDDVVVCGGLVDTGDTSRFDWTPETADTDADGVPDVAGCNRIRPSGAVEAFDPLPIPLAAGAMVELPDGGLLVTGGFSDHAVDQLTPFVPGNADAIASVWRWREGDGWRGIGSLLHPRAHHRMLPLDDGRILVIGGTETGAGLYGNLVGAVSCPELFDPVAETFTEMPCAEASGGADPLVAASPGEGAFVYEGFTRDGPIHDGSSRYGLVSTGPPLEP